MTLWICSWTSNEICQTYTLISTSTWTYINKYIPPQREQINLSHQRLLLQKKEPYNWVVIVILHVTSGAILFNLFYNTQFNMHFKVLGKLWGIFLFFIINSQLQSVQASRANINTLNFAICSIVPYSISTFKLNGSVWALSVATRTDKYWNT